MRRRLTIALVASAWSAVLCGADQVHEPDPWGEPPAATVREAAPPLDRPLPADRAPAVTPQAPAAPPVTRQPIPATAPARAAPPAQPPKEPEPAALSDGEYRALMTAYGTVFEVYVVGPEGAARGALLVHDQWGFNEPLRIWANRMAALGFRVVALDLYGGRPARDAAAAREAWRAVDPVTLRARLTAALTYMQRQQSRIVALGWGAGMRHAAWIAGEAPGTVTALITYRDAAWRGVEIRQPEHVAALAISTEPSLADPRPGQESVVAARREAWQATRRFLGEHFPE